LTKEPVNLSKSKWVMKQYWRLGTIRALLSLGLGMFTLGKLYLEYVPGLSSFGLRGALLLGASLFFFFLGLGWLYDVRAKMWRQQVLVNIERNPYQYIPNLKTLTFDYPIVFAVVTTLQQVLEQTGLPSSSIVSLRHYLARFFSRRTSKRDIFSSLPDANEFMRLFPFSPKTPVQHKVPLGERAKKFFELQKLRLSWVQSLIGLGLDALVFGALYVTVLFPTMTPDDPSTILFGVLTISLPLYTAFLFAGWLYDRRLRIWSADAAVKIERNPYTWIPEPRLSTLVYPFFMPVLYVLRNILAKKGVTVADIDRKLDYLRNLAQLRVERTEDMERARMMRRSLGQLFNKVVS